jgi:hypothetical protein
MFFTLNSTSIFGRADRPIDLCVPIRDPKEPVLFREIIAVYSEKNTKHIP